MKSKNLLLIAIFFGLSKIMMAQTVKINDKTFFTDDRPFEMKLSVDMKNLKDEKKDLNYVEALISCTFPDSSAADGKVRIKHRGLFRKENCRMASLMIDFKTETSPAFSKLGTLKMVGGCGTGSSDEQYLLKEYLIYKIYNLLTDISFRVRLMHVSYNDTRDKQKPYSQYAFLIEDIDDLAKRNKCREKEGGKYSQRLINRDQATLLYIFQYMIGNTDWSITYYHNIKLIVDKKDTLSMPYPVAYDFDMTGLVDPPYGVTPENLGIEKLTQRLYRGIGRSPEEIEATINKFLEKEEAIYSLINNFDLLTNGNKKEMINFLKGFFSEVKDKKEQKRIFVDNALKN
jgi:hypothetical protein